MQYVGFDLQLQIDCEQNEHCDRDSALKVLNPVLCVTGGAPGRAPGDLWKVLFSKKASHRDNGAKRFQSSIFTTSCVYLIRWIWSKIILDKLQLQEDLLFVPQFLLPLQHRVTCDCYEVLSSPWESCLIDWILDFFFAFSWAFILAPVESTRQIHLRQRKTS